MSDAPFFTVAVPTLNRASHFLPNTLAMLLRQSFNDFELLVSDNASDDATSEVVSQFSDPRIRYVRRTSRLSAGVHFAMVASEARGRYFVLNQDDDVLHLDFLRRAYEGLQDNPKASMFASPIWREQPQRGYSCVAMRPQGGYCDENVLADKAFVVDGPYAAAKFFDSKLHFMHPTVAISREHLVAVGGYDSSNSFNIDLVTQARVLMRGPLVYDPRPGGIFRVHAGNASRTMARGVRQALFRNSFIELMSVFDKAGNDWRRELDAYLSTLQFDEIMDAVRQWLYYRSPLPLQCVGMTALERAWPGGRFALHLKCASRMGVRLLARHWLGRSRASF